MPNEKISELMDWAGMTTQGLADALGCPRSTVSNYVNGYAAVSVEVAYKIAEVLEVTPWTILNREPLPATPLDLTGEESAFLTRLRQLPVSQRNVIFKMAEYMDQENGKQ